MNKPNKFHRFATNNINDDISGRPNVSEPSENMKLYGWTRRQKPYRQHFNWLHRTTDEWIEWLDSFYDPSITAATVMFNQSLKTTDSPTFAGLTINGSTISTLIGSSVGTTSNIWALDNDSAAYPQLKNDNGSLRLRNHLDNDDASLIVKNLTVNGTVTTVNSETVTIADNIMLLNSDVTGTPTQDAGIEIERGDQTNASLIWDEGSDFWKAGLVGSEIQLADINYQGIWKTISSNIYYNTGNVGIGTTNPAVSLDIRSTSAQLLLYQYSNNNVPPIFNFRKSRGATIGSLVATNSGDGLGYITSAGVNSSNVSVGGSSITFVQSGSAGATYIPSEIYFSTGTSSAATTEKMRITETGNVGIGITNSLHKLHVDGNVRSTGNLGVSNSISSPTGEWYFYVETDKSLMLKDNISGTYPVNIAYGAPSNSIKVLSNGNVGIGTTNPLQALDVRGNVIINGNASIGKTSFKSWGTDIIALQVGGLGAIWGDRIEAGTSFYSKNLYFDGTSYKPITSGASVSYSLSIGGAHVWYSDTGLTIDTAFTPTARMQLDTTGLKLSSLSSYYIPYVNSSGYLDDSLIYTDNNNVSIGAVLPTNTTANTLYLANGLFFNSLSMHEGRNCYYNTGFHGANTGYASDILFDGSAGSYTWYINSVTKNTVFTPAQVMSLSAVGRLSIYYNTTDTNTLVCPLQVTALTSGTAAAGFGAYINFGLEDADGYQIGSNRIASVWTDASAANRYSRMDFYSQKNNTRAIAMSIDHNSNVGIGTTNPIDNLHVEGSSTFTRGITSGYSNANVVNFVESYSCPVGTWVPIYITVGRSYTLSNGNNYKITLVTTATSTSTGAVYIVYQTASNVWTSKLVSNSVSEATVSNIPILRVNGVNVEIKQNHASASYDVTTFVTQYTTASTTNIHKSFFGLDSLFTVIGNYVGIGTTNPVAKLHINGLDNVWTATFKGGTTANQSYGINIIAGTSSEDYSFYCTDASLTSAYLVCRGDGNVGIGITNPSYKLQLNSDSAAKPSTNTWTVASDIRVKKNVEGFNKYGLEDLLKLRPVKFEYNGLAGYIDDGKSNVGYIAQEVEQIMPEMVSSIKTKLNIDDEEEVDLKNVNTHLLTFAIIEALRELKTEIDILKNIIIQ